MPPTLALLRKPGCDEIASIDLLQNSLVDKANHVDLDGAAVDVGADRALVDEGAAALHADAANLERLNAALRELQASVIAVPPLSLEHLHRGHAVHFRCRHPEAAGLRVDVMSKMRGVAEFAELWERRTTLQGEDGTIYELMSLPDLVQAKKTQRDRYWPMIRRLIEADRVACRGIPSPERVRFWLGQARTPELLIDLARQFPLQAAALAAGTRPWLNAALQGDTAGVEAGVAKEEQAEQAADRAYWFPLKQELARLRHA